MTSMTVTEDNELAPERPPVGGGVAGDGRIDAFKNLRQDVGVQQRLIHPVPADGAAPP